MICNVGLVNAQGQASSLYITSGVIIARIVQSIISMLFGMCAFVGLIAMLLGIVFPGAAVIFISLIGIHAIVNTN